MARPRPACFRPLALLLTVFLSLGSLQCIAAAPAGDDPAPASCCARDGDVDASGTTGTDPELPQVAAACPGACPGTAALHPQMAPMRTAGSAGCIACGQLLSGRSLAPDPHPPRATVST